MVTITRQPSNPGKLYPGSTHEFSVVATATNKRKSIASLAPFTPLGLGTGSYEITDGSITLKPDVDETYIIKSSSIPYGNEAFSLSFKYVTSLWENPQDYRSPSFEIYDSTGSYALVSVAYSGFNLGLYLNAEDYSNSTYVDIPRESFETFDFSMTVDVNGNYSCTVNCNAETITINGTDTKFTTTNSMFLEVTSNYYESSFYDIDWGLNGFSEATIYTWYKDDVFVGGEDTYNLDVTKEDDTLDVYVDVSDQDGTVSSNTITLDVETTPGYYMQVDKRWSSIPYDASFSIIGVEE